MHAWHTLPPSSARPSPMPTSAETRRAPTKSNEMPQQQPRKGKQQENGHEEKVTAIQIKTTTRDHAEHRRICGPEWDLNCRCIIVSRRRGLRGLASPRSGTPSQPRRCHSACTSTWLASRCLPDYCVAGFSPLEAGNPMADASCSCA